MKKIFRTLLLILGLITLCGCGSSKESDYATNGSYQSDTGVVIDSPLKLSYKASYFFYTNDIKKDSNEVTNKIRELNGYYTSVETSSYNTQYVYKVPTSNLDTFLNYMDSKEGCSNKRVSVSDVTSQYAYTQAKIDALTDTKEAYEALLETSGITVTEIAEIQEKLTDVISELNSINQTKAYYDSIIDYSEVTINFYLESEYEEKSFIAEYLENIGEFFVGLGIAILYIIPIGGSIGAIAFGVTKLVKYIDKKYKQKNSK